jgi:glycosyltransferase involved in cell wall biosynthesis
VGARVTAVIPCFNSAQYVAAAVSSALGQTFTDLEVVVVNDGSTDNFDEAIKPFEDRVRLLCQPNKGLSAARNAALVATDSEFVAYLDADDLWRPSKIARQIDRLKSDREIGFVHTGVAYVDTTGRPMDQAKVDWSPPDRISLVNLLEHNIITASSVLQRRSAFEDGHFCLELEVCSDWDLWLRILGAGHSIGYVPEAVTEYRIHESNMSKQTERLLAERVVVMERLLSRPVDQAAHSAAQRLRLDSLRDLGHFAYERGDLQVARALYLRAGRAVGFVGTARLIRALVRGLSAMVRRAGRTFVGST